ncbi:hypothetical protein PybrP1_003291 [[Pythium] brassicae (nom. inval.)]|nr:hypothetical protein PybrP1_003291 [[Pythium] brassicae (nom. inval.)]
MNDYSFLDSKFHPHIYVAMMIGDGSGAFRHVPIHANHAHMFNFVYAELLAIDYGFTSPARHVP